MTIPATIMSNGIKPQLKHILEHHRGRSSAITRHDLRLLLNDIPDRRLRLIKNELVREGVPILSATKEPAGYYVPATHEELRTGLKTLQSYIIELCRDYRDIKKSGRIFLEKPAPPIQDRLL